MSQRWTIAEYILHLWPTWKKLACIVKNTFGFTILFFYFQFQCYWQDVKSSTDLEQQFSAPFKAGNSWQVQTCYIAMVQMRKETATFSKWEFQRPWTIARQSDDARCFAHCKRFHLVTLSFCVSVRPSEILPLSQLTNYDLQEQTEIHLCCLNIFGPIVTQCTDFLLNCLNIHCDDISVFQARPM